MKGKILGYVLVCIVSIAASYLLEQRQIKKIGVVNAVKLFENFDMKQEMEANEKAKLQTIAQQVDSVGNLLHKARAEHNDSNIKKLAYASNYVKAALDQEYKKSNQEINEQVWKRLNPIVDEYGRQKGLHLIVGANGMGSVLYNDDYFDLTDELIKYANKKYEGGN